MSLRTHLDLTPAAVVASAAEALVTADVVHASATVVAGTRATFVVLELATVATEPYK